jgi:hypothetical protein
MDDKLTRKIIALVSNAGERWWKFFQGDDPLISLSPKRVFGIDLSREELADLVESMQNEFAGDLPHGYRRLRELETAIPERINNISERLQPLLKELEQIRSHRKDIKALVIRFDTVGEASEQLPESIRPVEETRPDQTSPLDDAPLSEEELPLYLVGTELFGIEVCFAANDSMLRVAALGRLAEQRKRREIIPDRTALEIYRLRLSILRETLAPYESAGIVPEPMTGQEARTRVENAIDHEKRGRPPKVAEGASANERVKVLLALLEKPEYWHSDGRHRGSPKWGDITAHVNGNHPELFRGRSKFPLTDGRIRQIAQMAESIDLDALRESHGFPPLHSERN